jgi:hypothetical protein
MDYLRKSSSYCVSSLADTGSDWTAQEERALLEI